MKKILTVIIIAFLAASCGNDVIFKESKTFKDYNWERFNELEFSVPVKKIDQNYDIILHLRYDKSTTLDYLKFQLNTVAPSGEVRASNGAFSIRDRNGNLQGDGDGSIREITLPVKKYAVFNEKGTYKFVLRNLMDKFDNRGVVEVTLEVKKVKLDIKIDD